MCDAHHYLINGHVGVCKLCGETKEFVPKDVTILARASDEERKRALKYGKQPKPLVVPYEKDWRDWLVESAKMQGAIESMRRKG